MRRSVAVLAGRGHLQARRVEHVHREPEPRVRVEPKQHAQRFEPVVHIPTENINGYRARYRIPVILCAVII